MAPVIGGAPRRASRTGRRRSSTPGQHYDRLMSEIFLEELGRAGARPHARRRVRQPRRADRQGAGAARAGARARSRRIWWSFPATSTRPWGRRSCAAKLGIPVAHVESGLRSFDRAMPEETNRIATDHLSALCFLHSEEAIENLRAEGVADERMKFVGNTMIDTLVALEDRFRERGAAASLGVEPGELPARHAAPAGARRRAAARRRRWRALAAVGARDAGGLPGPSAHAQDARRRRATAGRDA